MQYLQKLVKLQLVKVIGENGEDYFYVDFFSNHDFNQIQHLQYAVMDEVFLPLTHCETIRDNFNALYQSYKSAETDKLFAKKVSYNLSGDKLSRVRSWFKFYQDFSDNFLPE